MRIISKSHHHPRRHIACIAAVACFCVASLAVSRLTPQPDFETGIVSVAATPGSPNRPAASAAIAVKRVNGNAGGLAVGDIIEAVGGEPVKTRAQLYRRLMSASDGRADLTVRRQGARYQRSVSAADFADASLPPGVRSDDIPEFIADENGSYTHLNGSDFESLKSILSARHGSVPVIFKRPEEVIDISAPIADNLPRTLKTALALLFLPLMGAVALRGRRMRRDGAALWTNFVLGLGCIGMLTASLWTPMMTCAPLFAVGLAALGLFKTVDFDYHLTVFGKRRKTETLARIAIYAGPAATIAVALYFCIGLMPAAGGGDVMPNAELRLDSFILLPMIWVAIYALLDAAVLCARRSRRNDAKIEPHEIGIFFSALLSVFVIALLHIDASAAQMFLMAAILASCLGDAFGIPAKSPSDSDLRLDSPIFSTARLRAVLGKTKEIFDDSWLVQVIVDRPSPRHIVALTTTDSDAGFGGIDLNILDESWRDFLEVFRIEDTVITGDAQERDAHNPAQGIADKLGIVIALPIGENVAGTLSSLTFAVSSKQLPVRGEVPVMRLSPGQRERLSEIIDELRECAAAAVYQSAEISLEFVGEDIDEFTRRYHETASFARAVKDTASQINNTAQLDPRALPHGLIDEDDFLDDAMNETKDEPPQPTAAADGETSASCETRQYEDEIAFLRSQVSALRSQQIRAYALSEISFTQAQNEAASEMAAVDPPILIVGEPGTGKRTLALAAHRARSQNAFLSIDAAIVSESIFALDMFGDGQDPGLIASAAGGGLLIQNAERVGEGLMNEVIETIERLPAKDNVALYLTVNTDPDAFCVDQYRRDPSVLPENIQKLADCADAEIVVLSPLRNQDDLDDVAEFFCQKQAFSVGKNVEAFSAEALLALKSYAWPGNFGELRAVIERAVLRCEGSVIAVGDLGRDFAEIADASTKNLALSGTDVFREQARLMQILNETLQGQVGQLNARIRQLEDQARAREQDVGEDERDEFLDGSFADIEKRLLEKILDKYDRDPDKAARALELNRSRFISKLSKYGLLTDA